MVMLGDFPVEIKRHIRSKRMKLRYDAANDCAIITMPPRAKDKDAFKFAKEHLPWLEKQRMMAPEVRYLAPDQVIPYLGVERTIIHDPDKSARVLITEDEIIVGGRTEGFSVRLENHLKKEARKIIEPIAYDMADIINKKFKRIHIRDTKSRWGRCSSSGTISFSWRLIMTPPEILEYVVAHEIAHLKEMNHSAAFWRVVDELVYDAKISRKWLKNEGQDLMLITHEQ